MSLDTRCVRCQGYFKLFGQAVIVDGEAFCVQCDAAIKAGAPKRMYSEELPPASNILDDQKSWANYVNGRRIKPA